MSDLFGNPAQKSLNLAQPRAARGSDPLKDLAHLAHGVAPRKAGATPRAVHKVQGPSPSPDELRKEREVLYLDLMEVRAAKGETQTQIDLFKPAVHGARERLTAHFEQWGPPPTPIGADASAPLYADLDAANRAMAPHTKRMSELDRQMKAILARLQEINQELEL